MRTRALQVSTTNSDWSHKLSITSTPPPVYPQTPHYSIPSGPYAEKMWHSSIATPAEDVLQLGFPFRLLWTSYPKCRVKNTPCDETVAINRGESDRRMFENVRAVYS